MFLKISSTRGVIHFGSKEKLSSRFIGHFDIMERVGPVAYRLALPPSLKGLHDVFHVSQLMRYVRDEKHVLDHSELALGSALSYKIRTIATISRQKRS